MYTVFIVFQQKCVIHKAAGLRRIWTKLRGNSSCKLPRASYTAQGPQKQPKHIKKYTFCVLKKKHDRHSHIFLYTPLTRDHIVPLKACKLSGPLLCLKYSEVKKGKAQPSKTMVNPEQIVEAPDTIISPLCSDAHSRSACQLIDCFF